MVVMGKGFEALTWYEIEGEVRFACGCLGTASLVGDKREMNGEHICILSETVGRKGGNEWGVCVSEGGL